MNGWPEWTDALGQKFSPGDYVAYAGMSYKSADLVIGVVDKINRYRGDGSEIVVSGGYNYMTKAYDPDKPSCTVRIIPLVEKGGIWDLPKSKWVNGEEILPNLPRPRTLQKTHHIVKLNWTPDGV